MQSRPTLIVAGSVVTLAGGTALLASGSAMAGAIVLGGSPGSVLAQVLVASLYPAALAVVALGIGTAMLAIGLGEAVREHEFDATGRAMLNFSAGIRMFAGGSLALAVWNLFQFQTSLSQATASERADHVLSAVDSLQPLVLLAFGMLHVADLLLMAAGLFGLREQSSPKPFGRPPLSMAICAAAAFLAGTATGGWWLLETAMLQRTFSGAAMPGFGDVAPGLHALWSAALVFAAAQPVIAACTGALAVPAVDSHTSPGRRNPGDTLAHLAAHLREFRARTFGHVASVALQA